MPKIAVIGICGNSIFLKTDHFHGKGETLVADSMEEEIGGKGFNQALAAARMGAEVSFLAAVGEDDVAKRCQNTCLENNILTYLKLKGGKKTTFAFILTDKNGENQVTEYMGAELTREDVLEFEPVIAASDLLLLQHEVPDPVNETAAEIAAKHGVKIILNPAPARKIPDSIAEKVYLFTPNEAEKKEIHLSGFKNVITTLGEKGCMIGTDCRIPSRKCKAVDTTGAGDTFNGILAVCLAEKMDLKTACLYAVTGSGLSVTKPHVVDAIPYRSEIEKVLEI